MLHIGILAHSADGAALCFLEMVRESARRLGPHEHPEITLSIRPMAPTLALYEEGKLDLVRDHLSASTERLAAAGCDFFVCPDNTAHIALERPGEPFALPGLHIAEVVAAQAKVENRTKIGLLGTKWTMGGPVYPSAFARAGIAMTTPSQADRLEVDRIIFEELCRGILTEESRQTYIRIIEDLKREGCDAVALCCTEIPLLITPDISPIPTLDSTRLLAHEAIRVAIANAPLPPWKGGQALEECAGQDGALQSD